MHAIEAGGGGSGYVKIFVGPERQMVGRYRRFERGEHVNLPLAADLEDGAAAIADVEIAVRIEDDASGHAHAFHINCAVARRRHAVDVPLLAAGNVEHVVVVDGHSAGVHQITDKGRALAGGGVNLKN